MKLLKTVNQKIVINTYQVTKDVTYKEYLLNGKLVKEQSRLECNKTKLPFEYINARPVCLNKTKFNEYRTTKTFQELFDTKSKFCVIENFDKSKNQTIYFVDYGYWEVLNLKYELEPITVLFDYTGSLSERFHNDPIYRKILDKLLKHKYLVELKEFEIPFYNSNFSGQKGVEECRVFIPKKKYNIVYNSLKEHENRHFLFRELQRLGHFKNILGVDLYGFHALLKEYWDHKYEYNN
jgi:hypothetical protein